LKEAYSARTVWEYISGGGLGLVGLAHDALPGDHGAVVHLAQLVVGLYVQRPDEMLHIELVGAPRSFAFLLGEPDLFLGIPLLY
jgi:hypothetical protein